jgi:hypothetical protein
MIPKQAFLDYYYISSFQSKTRRKMILEYCGTSYPHTILRLNELVLWESRKILKKKGQNFNVASDKSDKRTFKLGSCYSNAVMKMNDGFGYVEGFVRNTKTGQYIGHAWNVDKNGTHWDFTYKKTENFEYYGVFVPEEIVWMVGERNGHIWYSVLPFVDNEFNYKETSLPLP